MLRSPQPTIVCPPMGTAINIFLSSMAQGCVTEIGIIGTSKANVLDKVKQAETGDGRQRHGRRAHDRGAAEDRARPLRHHRVRRRAAPATTTASCCRPCWPASRRVDEIVLNSWAVVRRQRHHAARRQEGGRDDRPAPASIVRAEDGTEEEYDRLLIVHRLQPVHAAGAGQGPARRHRLPRHRRHRTHDRGVDATTRTRS